MLVENGKDVVNTLIENYGFGVERFLEVLPTDSYLQKRHTEIFKQLEKKYQSTGKQTNAIALVLLADEILKQYIFEDEVLSLEQAGRFFAKEIDEAERIYDKIIDWFNQNINKFKEDAIGEVWGKYETTDNEISAIYVIPKVLKDYLIENGISFDGIKEKLANLGYIEKDPHGKFTQVIRLSNVCCRCIKILIKQDMDVESNFETKSNELPF